MTRALLILTLILFSSCSNKHCFKCKDGNTVCVDEQIQLYPAYAKQYSFALNAALKIINNAEAKGNVELNKSIILLKDKLDQESNRLEIKAKTALAAFQTTPCDSVAKIKFWECMNEITKDKEQLDTLTKTIKVADENGDIDQVKKAIELSICVLDKMILPCILK